LVRRQRVPEVPVGFCRFERRVRRVWGVIFVLHDVLFSSLFSLCDVFFSSLIFFLKSLSLLRALLRIFLFRAFRFANQRFRNRRSTFAVLLPLSLVLQKHFLLGKKERKKERTTDELWRNKRESEEEKKKVKKTRGKRSHKIQKKNSKEGQKKSLVSIFFRLLFASTTKSFEREKSVSKVCLSKTRVLCLLLCLLQSASAHQRTRR